MRSPSEIAEELVRIADNIDSSQNPSASRVAADIAAAVPGVIISESTHGEFDKIKESSKRDENTVHLKCSAKHVGTVDGKPFELDYQMFVDVTSGMDADEDGAYGYTAGSSDGLHDTELNMPALRIDGQLVSLDATYESIISSDAFMKADKTLSNNASDDAKDSDEVSDWQSDVADSESFSRDPYAYHGVKRSDFY